MAVDELLLWLIERLQRRQRASSIEWEGDVGLEERVEEAVLAEVVVFLDPVLPSLRSA